MISLDEHRRRRQLESYYTRRAQHDRERMGLDAWPRSIGTIIREGLAEIWGAIRSVFRRRR